ncbi:saposin b domain-containing protein [Stylonychia lemnae]|uniref:Sphingomyelin phosphodiesterase n=1 Tax=Stylonychia lemnae TaxID=5949 RepID=A0A078AEF5_STYLE|nr:saposin b domain-containing protein [Stylonychia lemnae]|eukprot:CDW80649.1 saposin b domain-containing protein [Stylonychia lemnae]
MPGHHIPSRNQQGPVTKLVFLTVLGLTLLTEPSQQSYQAIFKGMNAKEKVKLADDLEYYQSAVDHIKRIIDEKSGLSSSSASDGSHKGGAKSQESKFGHKSTSIISTLTCDACWIATDLFHDLVSNYIVQDLVETAGILVCSTDLSFSICRGYVNSLKDVVIKQLEGIITSPKYLCTDALNICEQKYFELLDPNDFTGKMLADKPNVIQNDDFMNNLYETINNDSNKNLRPTFKAVHFTDVHTDFYYVSGASTQCDNIICCRKENGFPTNKSIQAGPLGAYGCDIPIDVLTTMGDYINAEINPDVIFWTGDITPHDQWHYTVDYVTEYQTWLANFMKANFSDYVIYPLEGNHDFGEANSQSFIQPDPMLDINLKLWSEWLDENAQQQYAKAGYYTQKLKLKNGTVFDKVNVVAINSQPCYQFNFYLWNERDDPGGVLQWLNETLHAIEARGEIALFISHIPPGEKSCLYQWSIRYKAITDRFQHLIRFSIFGHVHEEIHNTVNAVKSGKPIGVQYWSGSVSTFSEINPSFRVFEFDLETFLPVKISTYFLNLEEENPKWNFHHEMTDVYGMKDLSPSSFRNLSQRILNDEQTAVLYTVTKSQGAPQTRTSVCDQACRQDAFCETTNNVYLEYKDCMGEPRYSLKQDPLDTALEYLADPWIRPV